MEKIFKTALQFTGQVWRVSCALGSEWRNQKSERNRNRNFFPIPKFFDTESDTFFDTKIFRNRYRYFFRYQKFSKPIPILFFDTNFFWNQYRYFFRYQQFSKPIPILFWYQFFLKPIPVLFSIPNISEIDTDTVKTNGKVSKPKCHTLYDIVSCVYFLLPFKGNCCRSNMMCCLCQIPFKGNCFSCRHPSDPPDGGLNPLPCHHRRPGRPRLQLWHGGRQALQR